jgi:hypothetical protein
MTAPCMLLTMVEQLGRVVKPEVHGTHHLRAVKPGCRDPAAVAGLGHPPVRIHHTKDQRDTWTSDQAFGGSVDTIATATSAVHDEYMIT